MHKMKRPFLTRLPQAVIALALTIIACMPATAQDTDGWKTILATAEDLKDYPKEQASLEDGLLHVRQGNGILIPQPTADGAIRARFHFRERTGFPQLRIRRNGNSAASNADYYEIIFFIRPGQTSVKEGYVNVTTRGKGRRLGVVPLAEPFALGSHVDVELSTVDAHLQILVNGKSAFEINDSTVSGGGYWGVAALDAWFSHIQVRPLLPKSTDPRLIQLEEAYEAAVQREVAQAYAAAVAALDATYLAALDRALEAIPPTDNSGAALALRTEKKRVEDKAPLPADDNAVDAKLKPLRTTYRTALAERRALSEQNRQLLREKFLQALADYQEELARANNLNGALEVRKRREFEAAR